MKFMGIITKEERDELRVVFMRKNALKELVLTFSNSTTNTIDDNSLYEKLVNDIIETNMKMELWWTKISSRYGWDYTKKDSWNVNFETCEVYLIPI